MARGKKLYDKRQDIAKKDQRREAERDFKVKNLYWFGNITNSIRLHLLKVMKFRMDIAKMFENFYNMAK